MKKNYKTIEIDLSVWQTTLYVDICTRKEGVRRLRETVYTIDEDLFTSSAGLCLQSDGHHPLIWVCSELAPDHFLATLSHEITHAVWFTLNYAGYKFDVNNQEPFTMTQTKVLRDILQELKVKKL